MSRDPKIIHGRPDLYGPRGTGGTRDFGQTALKRHPPYIYSKGPNASLVHKVARVELQWYEVASMNTMRRLDTPRATAQTVCGQQLYIRVASIARNRKERATMCELPAPGAVLCGRCHGEVASFGQHGEAKKAGITRKAAHQRLGCMVEGYGFGV